MDRGDHGAHVLLRRPGRGRRALPLAAIAFLRLLTRSPLRPFSLLARFLAALRTRRPSRPSATACGFLCVRFFFIDALHPDTSLVAQDIVLAVFALNYSKRFTLLNQGTGTHCSDFTFQDCGNYFYVEKPAVNGRPFAETISSWSISKAAAT